MKELYCTDRAGISLEKVASMCDELLAQYTDLKKVLIVPPDYTRCYSFAGEITKIGNTSRQMKFEARKVVVARTDISASAADFLEEPIVVARATGTCVTPKDCKRK